MLQDARSTVRPHLRALSQLKVHQDVESNSNSQRFLKYCKDASLYKINHKKDLDSKVNIDSMANKVVKREGPTSTIADEYPKLMKELNDSNA